MNEKIKAQVSESKLKTVKELQDLFKKHRTFLVCSIKGIPASQFQEIGKKLRGKAIIKVPKKSLIHRAIDSLKIEEIKQVKEKIADSFAILFSDMDSFELAAELVKTKSPSKAKAGQISPIDIEVEEGPTELVPGPAISELGALGIQIEIQKGKIHIKESKAIVKKDQKISQAASDIMSKLGIKPFSIGFIPVFGFDIVSKKLYKEIKVDREKFIADIKEAYSKAIPFAVNIGYFSKDTIKFMLAKAAGHEKRLVKIISGEPEETPEVNVSESSEHQKQDKKEESSSAEGLASLFG